MILLSGSRYETCFFLFNYFETRVKGVRIIFLEQGTKIYIYCLNLSIFDRNKNTHLTCVGVDPVISNHKQRPVFETTALKRHQL